MNSDVDAKSLSDANINNKEKYIINIKKKTRIAILLAVFTGFAGGHKFYQNKKLEAWLYLLFFWTLIPAVFSLIDIFFIPNQIKLSCRQKEIANVAFNSSNSSNQSNKIEQIQHSNKAIEIVLKIFFGFMFAWILYAFVSMYIEKDKLKDSVSPKEMFLHFNSKN